MPDALTKIDVSVETLARPFSGTLLAARTAIRITPELQELFRNAREAGDSAEVLADKLLDSLPDYLFDPQDLGETCRYLADEFTQMGDHMLLISAQTGRAVARVTEDDIYLPAPVSRETGTLAQPLPRIRPELEGLIVQWQFAQAHNQKLVQELAQRLPTTELLATTGDPRLLRVTPGGRRQIVEQLAASLDEVIHGVGGMSRELLKLCKFSTPDRVPAGYIPCAPGTTEARVVTPVVDPLTFNMKQDPYTTLRAQIGVQWVRDIAKRVSGLVHGLYPVQEASVLDALPAGLWIAEPNTAMALRGKRVLPVPGATTTLIHEWLDLPAIYLSIRDDSYACASREFLGRWEVGASLEFTLYLNPDGFSAYKLKDVPESGIAVEVLL